jgi:uncharacterized protein
MGETSPETTRTHIQIGTARSERGKYTYGSFEAVRFPTGGSDAFPIIIGQGHEDGPTLWVTASIHGNEYTGLITVHQLLTEELLANMRGTIVVVPTLNPAGIRNGSRAPYYHRNQDPNRLFPAFNKNATDATHIRGGAGGDPVPPYALETAYARLFESIEDTADGLIDLHNYNLNSIPFAFRDAIYYKDDRAEAEALRVKLDEMTYAFGHTVINEFASADYLRKNLHRSVSGAVLNKARIPAITVELGGYLVVDQAIVDAAVVGIRNVMRWMGMLESAPEPITGIKVVDLGYPVRRLQHPFVYEPGIAHFLVKSGDVVKKGDPIARYVDIYGRPITGDGFIRTDYDGMVLGVCEGSAYFAGEHIATLAVRDDSEMILPFPE